MSRADRPIRVLYATSLLHSIIEQKILERLAADPRVEVEVVSSENHELCPGLAELGIPIHRASFRSWNVNLPMARRLCLLLRQRLYVGYLKRLVQELSIDVIHAGWLTADATCAVRTGFHPVLARSWGSDVLNDPTMRNPHTTPFLRRRLEETVRLADAIYSDNAEVAKALKTMTGVADEKLNVFPQFGADTALFRADPELRARGRERLAVGDRKVLFNLRTLGPVYAIDDLIRAMPKVVAQEPEALLVLLGRGPLKDELVALTKELGMDDYVRFAGGPFVPTEELPMYYNAADVYVSTSLSDGSSLSLIEAMACELPAVVTDVPSVAEWVVDGDGGYVVPRGNSEAIADGLVAMLASAKEREQFGKRNRRIAEEKGDSAVNYEKLISLYQQLTTAGVN